LNNNETAIKDMTMVGLLEPWLE